jgi:hypothetical protein
MPRTAPGPTGEVSFRYAALTEPAFSERYGFADPVTKAPRTLCSLLQQGDVHEIWLTYSAEDSFRGDEILELKQQYDAVDSKIAGALDRCAGNGCFSPSDAAALGACGVTVRVKPVLLDRGPGCVWHALGHGFEQMALKGSVPHLQAQARHFFNFDLDTRLGLPFGHWGAACALESTTDCVTFTGEDALEWTDERSGRMGSVPAYGQGCGAVHFPPNARKHYDYSNNSPVLSTCEHYGMHDGPDGGDAPDTYTAAKGHAYDQLVARGGDCGGGWQIYLRQSFPGLGTAARAPDGSAMRNWWPYLFY